MPDEVVDIDSNVTAKQVWTNMRTKAGKYLVAMQGQIKKILRGAAWLQCYIIDRMGPYLLSVGTQDIDEYYLVKCCEYVWERLC